MIPLHHVPDEQSSFAGLLVVPLVGAQRDGMHSEVHVAFEILVFLTLEAHGADPRWLEHWAAFPRALLVREIRSRRRRRRGRDRRGRRRRCRGRRRRQRPYSRTGASALKLNSRSGFGLLPEACGCQN